MPGSFNRLRNPSSPASAEDVAWIAGFFEGEGSVGTPIDPRSGKWKSYISFTQVNPEPMVKVHSLCGGSVGLRRWRGTNPNAQPILELRLYGERARALAWAIAPLVSKKRRRQLAPFLDRAPSRRPRPQDPNYRPRVLWMNHA